MNNYSNIAKSEASFDGEEIDIEMTGDTMTKEQYHFILESNVFDDDDEVSFDYTGDEFTTE